MGRIGKVLQWKLANIKLVPGKENIPVDVFIRLVIKPNPVPVFHILTLQSTQHQRSLIEKYHTFLCAHSGVDRTINLMTQFAPLEISKQSLAAKFTTRLPTVYPKLPYMSENGCQE